VKRFAGRDGRPPALAAEERDRLAAEIARAYRRIVSDLVALGAARGFAVRCFLQPVIFSKRVLAPDEAPLAAERSYVSDLYRATYDRIRADPPPGFADISDAFGDDPAPRFLDFCHVAESADAIVAARILAALTLR
jgi:hypothetical protein